MKTLKELEIEMRALLDLAKTETRSLTPEEVARFEAIEADIRSIRQTQDMETRAAAIKADLDRPTGDAALRNAATVPATAITHSTHDFRSAGELLYEYANNPGSDRLRALRSQNIGDGPSGGVLVPTELAAGIYSIASRPGVIAGGATIVPPGNFPDGTTRIPKLRQSVNVWGGTIAYWAAEGGTITPSDFKVDYSELTPKKLVVLVKATSEVLTNVDSMEAMIRNNMASRVSAEEDQAFITGSGVGKPRGITQAPCKLTVARTTAGLIKWDDIADMWGKALAEDGDQLVWITARQSVANLAKIKDTAGAPIWLNDARSGAPPTLFGAPVLYSDRVAVAGSAGDLLLVNRKHYHIKRGSMTIASSTERYFETDEVAFRLTWYVDGMFPLDSAYVAENGATYSPVVSLT